MIKTRALLKVVNYLSKKKIKEIDFILDEEGNGGTLSAYQNGKEYTIKIEHDSNSIYVIKTEEEWL